MSTATSADAANGPLAFPGMAYSAGITGMVTATGPAAGLSRMAGVRLEDLAGTGHWARLALQWEGHRS